MTNHIDEILALIDEVLEDTPKDEDEDPTAGFTYPLDKYSDY